MLPEKTSKHVGTATELTCLIPIKQGFIPTLDTRTYASRLRIVFKVLHGLRVAGREARTRRPILDIVDAASTVHTFSWAIVAERHLLLNVTFDRPWEPYIRVIWRDLGPLLDLFLCHCDGFVPSTGEFEPYAAFVRKNQVEAGFFYPSSSLTVDDQRYLLRLEKMQRDGVADLDVKAATLVAEGAETLAASDRKVDPRDAETQWLLVLKTLYSLRNVFPENSADHEYLHRAAVRLLESSRPKNPVPPPPEVKWFDTRPSSQQSVQPRTIENDEIQGGILDAYRQISHGCLLLARVEKPSDARKFIGQMLSQISRHASAPADGVSVNVAFTFRGLRELGVMESDLARFPREFREGMEARAGLLGDVRQNHPERWTLPEWNVRVGNDGSVTFTGSLAEDRQMGASTAPMSLSDSMIFAGEEVDCSAAAPLMPPVRMSSVDLVIILHRAGQWEARHEWTEKHPLYDLVVKICREAHGHGVRVLSVQPLRRLSKKRGRDEPKKALAREHFDFVDGISQPTDGKALKDLREEDIGELLAGFQNNRGDRQFPETASGPERWGRGSLMDKASFLVIRKLRQNVNALNDALKTVSLPLDREILLTKMMGRSRAGVALLDEQESNTEQRKDFHFADSDGAVCPFHSHIRRANPRLQGATTAVVPRIARRGLAYGPTVAECPDDVDRGMMFMAYNASIAEQFEVIQRWMSGGNTPTQHNDTAVFSGQPDPFLGLPDGTTRTYRFLHKGRPHQVNLGSVPFVTLQWGLYLFAPSINALEIIARGPGDGLDRERTRQVVELGNDVIKRLTTSDDWAAVLEDSLAAQSGTTAAVCAAIRADHNGVIRTPYGVVVASHERGMEVLRGDPVFSVSEYQERFKKSVGEGYLGMDDGAEYKDQSTKPNDTLKDVPVEEAYERSYRATQTVLEHAIERISASMPPERGTAPDQADKSLPLQLEPVIDHVLAQLARTWFDIPDDDVIMMGGRPPDENAVKDGRPPRCPFHFLAPSRYVFSSPVPRKHVQDLGTGHGDRLLEAVRGFVRRRREYARKNDGNLGLKGKISKALFDAIPDNDERLARTILGLVFGFVPTVYGNALQVLGLWLGDETLWRVQQCLLTATDHKSGNTRYDTASTALRDVLERTMQRLAVPSLLHRTVTCPTKLGDVALNPSDRERVVLVVSAMAQDLLGQRRSDVTTVFGGNREGDALPPTHACPGYHIAMGVLLGLLTAILERGPLTPGPAQVTVRLAATASMAPVQRAV